jgi:hypothetical protein
MKKDTFFSTSNNLEKGEDFLLQVPALVVKPSQQYDLKKVCVFCSQFFDIREDDAPNLVSACVLRGK